VIMLLGRRGVHIKRVQRKARRCYDGVRAATSIKLTGIGVIYIWEKLSCFTQGCGTERSSEYEASTHARREKNE